MGLLRLTILGAAAYGIYRYASGRGARAGDENTHDGLAALYDTRQQADLAIEHLVQEHGVRRSEIYVEPLSERNTAGAGVSGGDAPSGDKGSEARDDAPLNGAIRLSVAASASEVALLRRALEDTGARKIEAF